MVRTSRGRVETSESLRLEEVVDGIDATSDMRQLVAPAATTDDLRITSHVAGEASTHICAEVVNNVVGTLGMRRPAAPVATADSLHAAPHVVRENPPICHW
jgi:hypothetical protein